MAAFIHTEKVAVLAAQGKTLLEIAAELGEKYGRVRYVAQKLGIEVAKGSKGRPANENLHSRIIELANAGFHRSEIARRAGCSVPTVDSYLRRAGIKANRCRVNGVGLKDVSRAEAIASMYRQGLTLEVIGEKYGVTRERIRQILRKLGVNPEAGGQSIRTAGKRAARAEKLEAECLLRWGVPRVVAKQLRADGTLLAFVRQRINATARGIDWRLTLPQWLAIWHASGKLDQRGRGKSRYVMSRIKDAGGYEVGNVHIQLATENGREAVKQWHGKERKPNRGVFRLYPGTNFPWFAKVGKQSIGRFATEQEAVAARMAFMQANGYELCADGAARRRTA